MCCEFEAHDEFSPVKNWRNEVDVSSSSLTRNSFPQHDSIPRNRPGPSQAPSPKSDRRLRYLLNGFRSWLNKRIFPSSGLRATRSDVPREMAGDLSVYSATKYLWIGAPANMQVEKITRFTRNGPFSNVKCLISHGTSFPGRDLFAITLTLYTIVAG